MEKLIIIRGPSGAGKSSVAKSLKKKSKRKILLISADQLRNMYNDQGRASSQPAKEMIVANVLIGLRGGFDVILEGILNVNTDQPVFDKILKEHPEENYFFYLDVSYEETLRRHQTRPEKSEFGETEMKEWWSYASTTGKSSEIIIPEGYSMEETIAKIQKTAGI